MKNTILIVIFIFLILLVSLLARIFYEVEPTITWVLLSIEILVTVVFIIKFKFLSKNHFGTSVGISLLLIFIALIFTFGLLINYAVGDCKHGYCYRGTISSKQKTIDSVRIQLKNIDELIFNNKDTDSFSFEHVKKIAIKDPIDISGDYTAAGGIDLQSVRRIDSFPVIIHKDYVKYFFYKKRNEVSVKKKNGIIIIDLGKIEIN